jgi:hypothetical protein
MEYTRGTTVNFTIEEALHVPTMDEEAGQGQDVGRNILDGELDDVAVKLQERVFRGVEVERKTVTGDELFTDVEGIERVVH